MLIFFLGAILFDNAGRAGQNDSQYPFICNVSVCKRVFVYTFPRIEVSRCNNRIQNLECICERAWVHPTLFHWPSSMISCSSVSPTHLPKGDRSPSWPNVRKKVILYFRQQGYGHGLVNRGDPPQMLSLDGGLAVILTGSARVNV